MIWFLLGVGVLLVLLGIWGGPVPRRRVDKAARIPREATVQEAWDILTSPVQYDEELIKIPEHRPWFLPGSDRRFHRGLAVGFGAGLLVAALLLPHFGGGQAPQPPGGEQDPSVVQGPGQQDPGTTGPGPEQPPQGEPEPGQSGAGEEPPEPPEAPPEDEPAEVTVTVEPGSSSQDIAALLKEAELIEDERDFLTVVAELGVETRLQAGTFVIPKGALPIEIVNMLIQ
ncbi:hypothetical protein J2Z79_002201 [Symbiobacterium terraclitae]|uniref:Uncharacterized protein n=1 Tax=Symbiobacterium terraclitae TaxID=557451 RepID=A0ABS4JV07_9FIRM|nr:hypothetical protein [Symbiobacterium terraclitae]MBP2018786.1 hypothetical protein [Symbiobacterium terraclitae]